MSQHLLDFLQFESTKTYDIGLGAIHGRQYATGLLLAFYVNNDPCFVNPVVAPEFCVRKVMGSRMESPLYPICLDYYSRGPACVPSVIAIYSISRS
jgi:hypothetical protein